MAWILLFQFANIVILCEQWIPIFERIILIYLLNLLSFSIILQGHIKYILNSVVRVGQVVQRVEAQTGESSLAGSNPGWMHNVCIWIISLPVSDIQFSVPFVIRLCLYRVADMLLTNLSTDPWSKVGGGGRGVKYF